jgi:hypothetical protein
MAGGAGCVAVMNIGEDDVEPVGPAICDHYRATCEGVFEEDLVFGAESCEAIFTDATADGITTAESLGECFEIETCLELLICFEERAIFDAFLPQPACQSSGEPCLELCVASDCGAPYRCCQTDCTNGICD